MGAKLRITSTFSVGKIKAEGIEGQKETKVSEWVAGYYEINLIVIKAKPLNDISQRSNQKKMLAAISFSMMLSIASA